MQSAQVTSWKAANTCRPCNNSKQLRQAWSSAASENWSLITSCSFSVPHWLLFLISYTFAHPDTAKGKGFKGLNGSLEKGLVLVALCFIKLIWHWSGACQTLLKESFFFRLCEERYVPTTFCKGLSCTYVIPCLIKTGSLIYFCSYYINKA